MPYLIRRACLVASPAILALAGCHSALIDTTIHNHSGQTITLLEVDYPSASFGTQNLAPGADFHYRFKILGNGSTKLTYTDAAHHEHSSAGPELTEGTEGLLSITIDPSTVHWQTTFRVK